MALQDFATAFIPALLFIFGMLVIFGHQPNNDFLSIWGNDTYATPGQIGSTDINSSLTGTPFATQTSTGLVQDNNPFLNLATAGTTLAKIVHAFESAGNAFSDAFSFLPPEIRWAIGLPLLAIMTFGLIFFLLSAAGIFKLGGS